MDAVSASKKKAFIKNNEAPSIKKRALTNQLQKLRTKYGIDIVKSGFELNK